MTLKYNITLFIHPINFPYLNLIEQQVTDIASRLYNKEREMIWKGEFTSQRKNSLLESRNWNEKEGLCILAS
jgi:hypothetical protein